MNEMRIVWTLLRMLSEQMSDCEARRRTKKF